MIPESLITLVEKQPGNVKRLDRHAVTRALSDLGVPLDSEFAEFYLNYKITIYNSDVSDEQLCDVAEPSCEVAVGTKFAHEVWGLPARYVCFTSAQGDGGYLYEVDTGMVWDFSLSTRDNFFSGKEQPRWKSFFAFMVWYLSEAD